MSKSRATLPGPISPAPPQASPPPSPAAIPRVRAAQTCDMLTTSPWLAAWAACSGSTCTSSWSMPNRSMFVMRSLAC